MTVRERPMLFNGAMVRAILSGAKTQTRRAIKLPHHNPLGQWEACTSGGHGARDRKGNLVPEEVCIWHTRTGDTLVCPFGQPGDRLWGRETHAIFPTHGRHRADGERWGPWGGLPSTVSDDGKQIAYYREGFDRCDPGRWRPSIHMPRWACRLVLEITNVRVEQLQAISKADADAEGANAHVLPDIRLPRAHPRAGLPMIYGDSRQIFADLWDTAGGDWGSNPWVWVIEFKRVEVAGG
ncbi:hypothetical protein H9654_00485 [Stenotrophomonas sp. Sa5BUN4]|uniref:Morphogenetic protein n=2 Tax=Stenotrophomonas lacuserhaii TaxID=2760084 RepID=A0A8X8K272_9GAMM|nr:hypothetical protein [Stenotrophomonas pennii]